MDGACMSAKAAAGMSTGGVHRSARYVGREDVRVRAVKEAFRQRAGLSVACSSVPEHDLEVNATLFAGMDRDLAGVGPAMGFDVWDKSPDAGE